MLKIRSILIAVALTMLTSASHAGGIMGDLNAMFMSNSTAPGTMSTADRTGVFGGSFYARTPVKTINWVSFDPPRFDAGCGGVDLYGGSFSFINTTELTQLFRNIASTAAGLAFRAAIKAIAPSLDQLIQDFQALVQNLNNLAKNSCQLAHLIVDPLDKSLNTAVNGEGNVASQKKTVFSDSMSALHGYMAGANDFLKDIAKNNSKSGNGIMKALTTSKVGDVMGMATVPNIDASIEDATNPNSLNNRILVSLLGYQIAGISCQQLNEGGSANSTPSDAASIGTVACKGANIIELQDLIKGGGTGSANPSVPLKLYSCEDPIGSVTGGTDNQPCTKMKRNDFNYVGVEGWVNNMLFGNPMGDATSITPTSILGVFNSNASATLTTDQIKFAQTARVPLISILSRTNRPEARVAFAERLGQHIVDCMAARIGESIYKSASLLKASETGYTLTDDIKSRIDVIKSDYTKLLDVCRKDLTVLNIVQEVNQSTRFVAVSNR